MILTVTFNPAIDLTYRTENDLSEKETLRATESRFDAGGKGINVSSYLKALNNDTVATGLLGGFTGDYIRKELEKQGIAHDFVSGGVTRINTTVIADDKEYKINHSGPQTDEKVVKEVTEVIEEVDPELVVVSGSLPPGLDSSAVDTLRREVDSEVAVDLHGETLGELEEDYLIAKPNRKELSKATGLEVESREDAREAANTLSERGFEKVLASLGGQGALLVTSERSMFVEGLNADVKDTTGAGDALLSAFISGLDEGLGLEESLEKALAFATLVVETPGTGAPDTGKLEAYQKRVEIEEF